MAPNKRLWLAIRTSSGHWLRVALLLAVAPLTFEQGLHADEALLDAEALLDGEPAITDADRDHWSFRELRRPELPREGADWARNEIDRFIYQRLQAKRVGPMPAARKRVLARRVAFDLTGLPPDPIELRRFLEDRRPDAYERWVDRLLLSPAHGEHAAQFWLDLARFAETDGFEHDKVRPQAWRYRDWVVRASNTDLPFDQFVTWQLAGDELLPNDREAAVATMFCLAGPDMPDINSQVERRHDVLNELAGTIGSVMLGLQIGCAQCHDHKYDPISQADFYRLRAIFEPAVKVTKNRSLSTLLESADKPPPSYVYVRGDWRRRGASIEPAFPRIANPMQATPRADAPSASSGRRLALARWLADPQHPLTHRVAVNRIWQQYFGRGLCESTSDFGVMGDEPTHPELLDWLASELIRRDFSVKSLRRLIVTSSVYRQASGPATASGDVATANRLWERARAVDPSNTLYSRFPLRRLRGETIRDTMLAISDSLNRRLGGPGVRPPLPPELVATLLRNQWKPSPRVPDHYRRSIYIFARRNLRFPILEAFDRPAANGSCSCRDISTTAPQALLMMNSALSLDAARRLAGVVLATDLEFEPSSEDANKLTVNALYERVFGRSPSAQECELAEQFLREQAERLKEEPQSEWQAALPEPTPPGLDPTFAVAVTDLCLGLLNSNEFLYVD